MKRSDRFTNWLYERGAIQEEDRIIVQYGLNALATNLVSFLTALIMASVYHAVATGIWVLLLTFPLRKSAGGFHARNKRNCVIFSCLVLNVAFLLFLLPLWTSKEYFTILILLSVYIFYFAPIGTESKRLDRSEFCEYRKRTRNILLLEGCLFTLAVWIHWMDMCRAVVISFFIVALCLWMGRRRYVWAADLAKKE